MRSAPHWSLLKLHNAGLNPDLRPLCGNHSAPNGQWPCRLNNAIMGRLTQNSLTPGFMQHFRGQDSILTNGYPPGGWPCLSPKSSSAKWPFRVQFPRSALLVVDWMRTIIKRKKKKSAWVQQLCAGLPVVPMSLRVMRRDVCVGPTVCASRRFSPERQWWAQVSDSLLFTRRVPHADTKRERRRLDNFFHN